MALKKLTLLICDGGCGAQFGGPTAFYAAESLDMGWTRISFGGAEDLFFHHWTCQVKWTKEHGTIGKVLDWFEERDSS